MTGFVTAQRAAAECGGFPEPNPSALTAAASRGRQKIWAAMARTHSRGGPATHPGSGPRHYG